MKKMVEQCVLTILSFSIALGGVYARDFANDSEQSERQIEQQVMSLDEVEQAIVEIDISTEISKPVEVLIVVTSNFVLEYKGKKTRVLPPSIIETIENIAISELALLLEDSFLRAFPRSTQQKSVSAIILDGVPFSPQLSRVTRITDQFSGRVYEIGINLKENI